MKRIGVISDTHGSVDFRLHEALSDCDEIIHAGDICGTDVLAELEIIAPVRAVLGNNDDPIYGSAVKRFARFGIDGVRFLVAHKPNDIDISKLGSSVLAPGDPIPHVRIYGHTHVPELRYRRDASPSDVVLNPGALSRPRGGFPKSLAKIDVNDGDVLDIRIQTLDGDIIDEVRLSDKRR